MVDFSDLDSKAVAEKGLVLELVSPATNSVWRDEQGKAFFLRLLGMDSEKLRNAAKQIVDRRVNDSRRGKQADYDSDEAHLEKARLYALATIEWYIPPVDGQVWECNEKNARKLYTDPRFPWVTEYIDKKINDRADFFKQASPNS